jgi:hypothetical protein
LARKDCSYQWFHELALVFQIGYLQELSVRWALTGFFGDEWHAAGGICARRLMRDWVLLVRSRGLDGEPEHSLHVVEDIGQADFGSGASDADGCG